jgi:hypothetical protein
MQRFLATAIRRVGEQVDSVYAIVFGHWDSKLEPVRRDDRTSSTGPSFRSSMELIEPMWFE